MTSDEFKSALKQYRIYLKPALYTVLSENAEIFSDTTKKEIIDKLKEADTQMSDFYDYQEKRNNVLRHGLEKIEEVYKNVKARFQAAGADEKVIEAAEADKLISNL